MSPRIRGAAPGAATALASASREPRETAGVSPTADARSPDARPRPSPLESLYRRHRAWLVSALHRRFGRDQAEDLSQEAFARAARYANEDLQRPRALLLTLATRAAFERHRRACVRAPEASGAEPLHEDQLWRHGEQESLVLLKQVILDLPPKLQEVFVLSRFEGLTYDEIGRRCGISTKAVESRMTKALAICTARMRD